MLDAPSGNGLLTNFKNLNLSTYIFKMFYPKAIIKQAGKDTPNKIKYEN